MKELMKVLGDHVMVADPKGKDELLKDAEQPTTGCFLTFL